MKKTNLANIDQSIVPCFCYVFFLLVFSLVILLKLQFPETTEMLSEDLMKNMWTDKGLFFLMHGI